MTVPEQVRKQTEAVQALYKDLNSDSASSTIDEAPESQATIQGVEPSVSADEVAPPVSDEPDNGAQEETFEQKYRTLQGMYNSDVPRLTQENRAMSERVQQLENLVSTVQAAPMPVPAAEATAPVSLLTDDEVEEYGESIDIMRKVSREIAGEFQQKITDLGAQVAALQGDVIPRVEQLASQQARSSEQLFWSQLMKAAPDWREVNDSPDFQSWLLEIDPLSGVTRQSYLENAQQNMDWQRVAEFFNSWQTLTGTALAQPNRAASELEKQVTPGKGRASSTSTTGGKRTYTPKDIADFFTNVQKGKFQGKEKERNTIERDIFAAQAEGRIIHA